MLSVFHGSLEEMLMYNLNALKKSKCVKLIPNLTHLKIDFQSALPHVQIQIMTANQNISLKRGMGWK